MTDADAVDLNRLRWRCRRGLRELDELLLAYLERCWATAPAERRATFRALLELPDPELAALCLGRSPAPEPAAAALLAEITGRGELSGASAVYSRDFGCDARPERDP